MAEKKNIVIKLKYPTGQMLSPKIAAPKIITEWNYLRIAVALACIAAIGGLALYFLSSNPQIAPVAAVEPKTAPAVATVAEAGANMEAVANITPNDAAIKKKIRRAQLAAKIVDSEPVGTITLPIVVGEKEPVQVYYFAEIVDMKGKTVFHEWLLDDKLISRKTVNISDNSWRTSSRQMVAYTTISNWTVRLVNEAGQVLSEQKFTVALKK